MSAYTRRFSLSILIVVALLLVPRTIRAQESPDTPAIENSKFQATGKINANSVYIRSGANDIDYPVMKLDKGASLTVVGKRYDWLKVVPPEGSFCYVAKVYVDRRADGSIGRATRDLYVRVGSDLNGMKSKVAMKLEAGRDVTIVGEQDEYFKIKPPEGVYLYVNAQYVDAVKVNSADDQKTNPIAPQNPPTDQIGQVPANDNKQLDNSSEKNQVATNDQPSGTVVDNGIPTTNPSANPSTNPSEESADAGSQFDKLEIAYADMIQKPLDQQDVAPMLSSYEKLAKSDGGLPETLRRVAEAKAGALKQRMKDREQYLAVRKNQDEMKQRQMALEAERQELEQRLRSTDMKYYAAVGVLRPSSLQVGPTVMYRLTDPANGRTVIYLRCDDQKIGALLGQFIGVKGAITDDAQLSGRVISPTMFETVDQAKLNTTVASQIIPPSLMPGATASTTSGNE